MSYYSFPLPVWKQGDDFRHCLDAAHGKVPEALRQLAAAYRDASIRCERMAAIAEKNPTLVLHGDTHWIFAESADAKLLAALAREELLAHEGDDEDEDDDEEGSLAH